jgi:hypothetical protein
MVGSSSSADPGNDNKHWGYDLHSTRDHTGLEAPPLIMHAINECAPILHYLLQKLSTMNLKEGIPGMQAAEKAVVLDLCSGYGWLGMFMAGTPQAHAWL